VTPDKTKAPVGGPGPSHFPLPLPIRVVNHANGGFATGIAGADPAVAWLTTRVVAGESRLRVVVGAPYAGGMRYGRRFRRPGRHSGAAGVSRRATVH